MSHTIATHLCRSLVEELVQALPLGGGEGEEEGEGVNIVSTREPGGPTPDTVEVPDVTDDERRQDKEIRTEILLGLLRLACAMVRVPCAL